MQRLAFWTLLIGVCLFVVPTAYALTTAYGLQDIERAGVGCVGGWITDHGHIAYFCGNSEQINRQLAEIARSTSDHHPSKIILHTGKKLVENPVERPLISIGDQEPDQMAIDWSVARGCPVNDILRGRCRCDRQYVLVDIWVAGDITLDALKIPGEFTLESGNEIEKFIERHKAKK
jgi:hypothetical protein